MKNKILLSKKSDDWRTPKYIYDQIKETFFDPCPFHSKIDGLKIEWKERNFVNPPYSQLRKWIEKGIEEHKKGKIVLFLIPARTDTIAFKEIYDYGASIALITGRLKFNDSKESAPFPSMLVYLTAKKTNIILIDKKHIFIQPNPAYH